MHQLLKLVSVHVPSSLQLSHTHSTRKRIHTAQVHRYTPHPHTPNTHTAHIRSCAQTYTKARTHTASQYKGSDTLAQVRGYVFNRNGSAIDTRAGKNTHALVLARSFANRFKLTSL